MLPEGTTETFTYDAQGRLATHVLFEGVVTAHHHLNAARTGVPDGRRGVVRCWPGGQVG